jgi:hypothetical protein
MPDMEIKNASDGWGRASYNGWKTNDIWWLGETILSGTLDSVVGRIRKGTLGRVAPFGTDF